MKAIRWAYHHALLLIIMQHHACSLPSRECVDHNYRKGTMIKYGNEMKKNANEKCIDVFHKRMKLKSKENNNFRKGTIGRKLVHALKHMITLYFMLIGLLLYFIHVLIWSIQDLSISYLNILVNYRDYISTKWPDALVKEKIMKRLTQRCTDLYNDRKELRHTI